MASHRLVSRFNPNRTDAEVREAIFVQRQRLAEVWLERLRDSVLTGVKHHLLAIGPRGCGKSHLVALLVSRLRKHPAVGERARIAWLPEDETTPSFWKFLLRILRALNAEYGDEFPPPPRDQLADTTDDRRSTALIDYLLKHLAGRALLVVVENLDDVMRGLKDEGQKRWRAFLQDHPISAILATAPQLSDAVSDRDRPFFNFFQVEHLHPLSADEALLLLQKLAEHNNDTSLMAFLRTPTGRARVRAIRHIAGGSHRVFIILSEFATQENLDDLVAAFEQLLDELTPYYQERLRWLPDQQREIVEFLCRQVRTVPVKEIAGQLFLSEQTAAAQLKALKDKGYVTASSAGRESRYELAEPLMRLCVEVKDPRREPIRLIVEFLRIWYDSGRFQSFCAQLSQDSDLWGYLNAALQSIDRQDRDLIEVALDNDWTAAKKSTDTDELVRVARDILTTSKSAEWCYLVGYELHVRGRHTEAVEAFHRATDLAPDKGAFWLVKGMVLMTLQRHGEAAQVFQHASKFDGQFGIGYCGMGAALSELGQHEAALTALSEVIHREPMYVHGWTVKALVLNTLGRHSEALAALDRATQIDPQNPSGWQIKGETLRHLDADTGAVEAFARAADLNPDDPNLWAEKGFSLFAIMRHGEALEAFNRAVDLDPNNPATLVGKGAALLSLGQDEEALAAFDRSTELDPGHSLAWHCKGIALDNLDRPEEALKAFCRETDLSPDEGEAWLCRGACWINMGEDPGGMADLQNALKLDPGFHEAAEVLAQVLVRAGNWSETWDVLAGPFRQVSPKPLPEPERSHLPNLLAVVYRSTTDHSLWSERVARLVTVYAVAKALPYLGNALVWSLDHLDPDEVSVDAINVWSCVWHEIAEQHQDLSLATRLFDVGVRYLQTKNARILLDLVQEERTILHNLFGLDGTEG